MDKVLASTWFPGTAPLTSAAQTALSALDAAAATARDGSPADTQAMYVAAETTRVKITAIVLMVDGVAINNVPNKSAIISSAGLQEKKTGSRNVQIISVKPGIETGSAIVRLKAVRGFSYKIQMQKGVSVEPALWEDVTISTITRIPVSGLAPLNQYWFRRALIKGLTQGAYSSPVSISIALRACRTPAGRRCRSGRAADSSACRRASSRRPA